MDLAKETQQLIIQSVTTDSSQVGSSAGSSYRNHTSSSLSSLSFVHGLLNLLAWGVLVPIGIMASRYFKDYNPSASFFAHLAIEVPAFALAIAGIVTGIQLQDRISYQFMAHKALGFTVLAFTCIQIITASHHPSVQGREQPIARQCLNWFHRWSGRIAVVIGVSNTFYGIHLGGAGISWNVGLGITIPIFVLVSLALEAWNWNKYSKSDKLETPATGE